MSSVIATYNGDADELCGCEAIIVPCIDFCFHKPSQDAIERSLKIPVCVVRSEPGVSLTFAQRGSRLDALMADIESTVNAHHASKVILVDHSDCGAYKMAGMSFADVGIEEGKHEENLKLAKKVIHEKFPNVEVITLYAKKQGGKIELIELH